VSKSVVVSADITATASTTDQVNTWQKTGPLSFKLAKCLAADGQPIVLSASQQFTGTNKNSGVTVGPVTVTLDAGVTKLKDDGASILLDGDSKSDSFGNAVSAAGQHKLFSA